MRKLANENFLEIQKIKNQTVVEFQEKVSVVSFLMLGSLPALYSFLNQIESTLPEVFIDKLTIQAKKKSLRILILFKMYHQSKF